MKPQNSSKSTKLISTQIYYSKIKHKYLKKLSIRYHPCQEFKKKKTKNIRLGHTKIVDFLLIYRYQIEKKIFIEVMAMQNFKKSLLSSIRENVNMKVFAETGSASVISLENRLELNHYAHDHFYM